MLQVVGQRTKRFGKPVWVQDSGGSSFKAYFLQVQEFTEMKKNVASQKIGAQLVSATDGSAFTGAVTIYVTGDAGTQAVGSVGSGACTHEGNGYHTYAPAQAETNYDIIGFTFTGSGAVPVTVQVRTWPTTGLLAPTTADRTLDVSATGEAGIDWANVGSPTTSLNLSATAIGSVAGLTASNLDVAVSTLATAANLATVAGYLDTEITTVLAGVAAIEVDTQDIQSRLPAILVSGRIDASVGAMAANVLTASALATDAVSEIQSGLATPTNITAGTITTVSSVTAIAAGGITAASIATDAIDADALSADAISEIWAKAMTELTSVPGVTGTVLQALTWVFEMSRNKVTQTATTQIVMRDDGSTTLGTSTVSDDGTTFTRGEFA